MINIFILSMMDMIIFMLLNIAFFTLLERKILSYIQLRKGPNKVGMMGLFQPFSDAIKLFSKEIILIIKSNYFIYFISPVFSMLLMMILWMLMPLMSLKNLMELNFLMMICIMSISVYFIMLAGWSSNSIYSIIGMMRMIAQSISYEISMIFIVLSIFLYIESFNLMNLMKYQIYWWFSNWNFFLMMMLFISLLAEMNRTPFDLVEGESELVSGFNVEYMSGSFALIFIAEYGMIMLMMWFFTMIFFSGNIYSLKFYLMMMFNYFLVIWIRGTFPRFRYDQLMMLTWKSFLSSALCILVINIIMKLMMLI